MLYHWYIGWLINSENNIEYNRYISFSASSFGHNVHVIGTVMWFKITRPEKVFWQRSFATSKHIGKLYLLFCLTLVTRNIKLAFCYRQNYVLAMLRVLVACCLAVAVSSSIAGRFYPLHEPNSDELIFYVNNKANSTWKVDHVFFVAKFYIL